MENIDLEKLCRLAQQDQDNEEFLVTALGMRGFMESDREYLLKVNDHSVDYLFISRFGRKQGTFWAEFRIEDAGEFQFILESMRPPRRKEVLGGLTGLSIGAIAYMALGEVYPAFVSSIASTVVGPFLIVSGAYIGCRLGCDGDKYERLQDEHCIDDLIKGYQPNFKMSKRQYDYAVIGPAANVGKNRL